MLENLTNSQKCTFGYNFQFGRLESPAQPGEGADEGTTTELIIGPMTENKIILLMVALLGLLVLGVVLAYTLIH